MELTMRMIFFEILLFSIIGGIFPPAGLAVESGWNEAGVRIGIQATSRRVYFQQQEVFAAYGLPWEWRSASGWGLTQNINTALGALNGGGETGIIGSVASALILDKQGPGISTDVGINANLLNKRKIGSMDFGSILQFGAYLGINYRFNNGIKIGYRLQHISNGHIMYPEYTPNPGLDMHMIESSYVF